jgi:serine phosphatase RsbU (regulator of sigma subunit)
MATVLCGLAEVTAHRVTLASAGHLPPLVVRDSGASFPPVKPAAPMGIPQPGAAEGPGRA